MTGRGGREQRARKEPWRSKLSNSSEGTSESMDDMSESDKSASFACMLSCLLDGSSLPSISKSVNSSEATSERTDILSDISPSSPPEYLICSMSTVVVGARCVARFGL